MHLKFYDVPPLFVFFFSRAKLQSNKPHVFKDAKTTQHQSQSR